MTRIAIVTVMTLVILVGSLAARALGLGRPAEIIAYGVYRGADAEIYLFDIAHTLPLNATDSPFYEAAPKWSPDGQHLAFISNRHGGSRVYVMDAFSGRSWMVTSDYALYHSLRWLDDGARLLMMTGVNEALRMFTVGIDGSNFTELTNETVTAGSLMLELGLDAAVTPATVSPDGRYRLVNRYVRTWGLYLTQTDQPRNPGRRIADLGRAYTETSGWSPDGRWIYFLSSHDGMTDLYRTSIEGHVERLTFDSAIESGVALRPLASGRPSS